MRKLILSVALALLLLSSDFAQAQHHGGYGGYHGGGYYGGGYYGGYYHGGYYGGYYHGYGPRIGVGVGIGFYYPGYYSPYYYYPTATYIVPDTVVVPSNPTVVTVPSQSTPTQPTQPAQPAAQPGTQEATSTSALVTIVLPKEDAQVWLGTTEMTGQGAERRFQSPALEAGKRYSYQIKARWTENGKTLEGSQSVEVRQGANVVIDFRGPPPSGNPAVK